MIRFFLITILFLIQQTLSSQCHELPIDTMRMYKDLHYLASDELEGRYPGSLGDSSARSFIVKEMQSQNLSPYFGDSYVQNFEVNLPIEIAKTSHFYFLNKKYPLYESTIYPIYLSGNGEVKGEIISVDLGIYAPEAGRNDYQNIPKVKNSIFLIDILMPEGMHPHHALISYVGITERVQAAKNMGAKAVILYNSKSEERKPQRFFTQLNSLGLPVIYVNDGKLVTLLKDKKNKKVKIKLHLKEKTGITNNIGAFLDNNAEKTLIIGAHYDHLGMGGAGSRFSGLAIHHGADDNGSGIVALMELMRHKKSLPTQFNYLFLFFGAEEMGLLGSKHFVQTNDFKKETSLAMLNMDMIGRLDTAILLSGTGTAAEWDAILDKINCEYISLKKSSSGIGPSDHTSFYNKGLPVLHYFTGLHNDYHKPSDTPDKIYYEGMSRVLNHLYNVILNIAEVKEGLNYQETKDEVQSSTPRFKVTMGIMPDYTFNGKGLKLDGVSAGKPAEKAGLLQGDVIIKMAEFEINNIRDYMEFLSVMNKNSKAIISVLRKNEIIELKVEF